MKPSYPEFPLSPFGPSIPGNPLSPFIPIKPMNPLGPCGPGSPGIPSTPTHFFYKINIEFFIFICFGDQMSILLGEFNYSQILAESSRACRSPTVCKNVCKSMVYLCKFTATYVMSVAAVRVCARRLNASNAFVLKPLWRNKRFSDYIILVVHTYMIVHWSDFYYFSKRNSWLRLITWSKN